MNKMCKSLERAIYTAKNLEGNGQEQIIYELFHDLLEPAGLGGCFARQTA